MSVRLSPGIVAADLDVMAGRFVVSRVVERPSPQMMCSIFKKIFICSWRHREAEGEAERDVGLDSRTPGSQPEPKADAQPLSHPGAQWTTLCDPSPVASDNHKSTPYFYKFNDFWRLMGMESCRIWIYSVFMYLICAWPHKITMRVTEEKDITLITEYIEINPW